MNFKNENRIQQDKILQHEKKKKEKSVIEN